MVTFIAHGEWKYVSAGFANTQISELLLVAGNFHFVVLGAFGAITAVIVGFVLFKSRTPKEELDI